jgi:large subunit ribosomal protein L24
MALRIRKDDTVKVMAGKAKGRTGRVLRVDVKNDRVYVEGANMVKRHQRPTGVGQAGGVIEKEGPIHISNVMLLDPNGGAPTRVRIQRGEDGKRVRVAAKSGEAID